MQDAASENPDRDELPIPEDDPGTSAGDDQQDPPAEADTPIDDAHATTEPQPADDDDATDPGAPPEGPADNTPDAESKGDGDATAERPDGGSDDAEASDAEATPDTRAELDEAEVDAIVEAILFTTDTSLSPAKIAQVAELPGGRKLVKEAIDRLNAQYDRNGRAFRIEPIAAGYQMLTREEYNDILGRLLKTKNDSKLSQAALEALAIVAYRQPIIRADIESIRGVMCGEVLRKLMEKNLVKIVGRAEVLGRPMLYGTTRRFLELFDLNTLEDLPRVEELRTTAATTGEPARGGQGKQESAEDGEDGTAEDGPEGSADDAKQTSSVDADNPETPPQETSAETDAATPDAVSAAEDNDDDRPDES